MSLSKQISLNSASPSSVHDGESDKKSSISSQKSDIKKSSTLNDLVISPIKFTSLKHRQPRTGGTWSSGSVSVLGKNLLSSSSTSTMSRKLLSSLSSIGSHSSPPPHSSGGGGEGARTGVSETTFNLFKNPRPTKAKTTLEALSIGLRAWIAYSQEEIRESNTSISSLAQSVRGSERYVKRLECLLSEVDELGEEYGLQQRLREGVRAMAYAYSVSHGRERESALQSVKAGFKECTQVLASLEGKLQGLIGSFRMEIKGIQGFSRLCAGDVFEIIIKHGPQKWKSRGRICKDGRQSWDLPKAVFRGILGELFHIKAAEVKLIGKTQLLGNKFCEITQLFSPHSQLMTVNLNPTGSLKLAILINWIPIEMEGGSELNLAHSISPSRKRRIDVTLSSTETLSELEYEEEETQSGKVTKNEHSEQEFTKISQETHHDEIEKLISDQVIETKIVENNEIESKNDKNTEIEAETERCFELWTRSLESGLNLNSNIFQIEENESSTSISILSDPSRNFTFLRRSDKNNEKIDKNEKNEDKNRKRYSTSILLNSSDEIMEECTGYNEPKNLKEGVRKLNGLLEDTQGFYSELEPLENHIKLLSKLIKGSCFSTSSSSLNIESALECFDFLDLVGEDGGTTESSPTIYNVVSSNRYHSTHHEIMDPKMTSRTTDSGISSIGNSNSRSPSPDHSRNSSPLSSPLSGNLDLDSALETHIFISLQLIQSLGSFGPLKAREREGLKRLQEQGLIIGNILAKIQNNDGNYESDASQEIQDLWEKLTKGSKRLSIGVEECVHSLTPLIYEILHKKFPSQVDEDKILSVRVSQSLVDEIQGSNLVHSSTLTFFQFSHYLKHEKSFKLLVNELGEECILVHKLSKESNIINGIKKLSPSLVPTKNVLLVLLKNLIISNYAIQEVAKEYLTELCSSTPRRSQVLEMCVEFLESKNSDERESSVKWIGICSGIEFKDELNYIASMDSDSKVRKIAKEALLLLGETDEKNSSLGYCNFQGLGNIVHT